MTDPIGTAQERELIERVRRKAAELENGDDFFADEIADEFLLLADALQSRIAEGDAMREALQIIRQWFLGYEANFGTDVKEELAVIDAALSLHRRPT